MRSFLLVFLFIALAFGLDKFETYADEAPAFNLELSKHINSLKTTWIASERPAAIFANRTHAQAKLLMGTRLDGPKLPQISYEKVKAPDAFDSRTNWPECVTMQNVRDQSNCGSCWAFGAVEAISDRMCAYLGRTDAKFRNLSLSALDMLACCRTCGSGCNGGYPNMAWLHWRTAGLVTEDCAAYPLAPCEHHSPPKHYPACPSSIAPTPACPRMCADGTPTSSAPRYYAESTHSVSGEADYQAELIKGGPFEVAFTVYQDFETYKGGVYQHVSGPALGGHAVKLVGWGVDNGTPYWIVANSWNADWGEGGFFRILRGKDECGIETSGVAGVPKAP